ncbi:MAG: hypothetical protein CO022_08115 [Flavobacteriales bacterium CG_4_9_14_0_2_um_filter_32_27]|nr:type IX secretion system membrane protein PorP/SprF [Bacteroidota bacterium]PJC61761.1 MAG: hypothetical protein CO022_08115 [Flavobacteriales bacterium CG_4_9_14_0_2_um_filter_32_27]
MKKIIYILILMLAGLNLSAQQEAMFTHYMFNKMAINPGYTGTQEVIRITGLHRSQWVSFKGAPITQNIAAQMPIVGKNFGVGLNVANEQIGPTKDIGVKGNFSYHLKINEKSKLGLGLSVGVNFVSTNLNSLAIVEQNDISFANNINSKALPNFGFGAFYFTPKYFVGMSIPKLLQNSFETTNISGNSIVISNDKRHYYLMGGAIFNLTADKQFKIKPTSLVKVTGGAPVQIDLAATVIYNDKLTGGLALRSGDAMGILLGYTFNKGLTFGYSFDWSYTNKTFDYNGGSHEILLRYNIAKNQEKSVPSHF